MRTQRIPQFAIYQIRMASTVKKSGPSGKGKANQPLPAGSPGEIIPPIPATALAPDEWGVRMAHAGFGIDTDPAVILDPMTIAHLLHTRTSILEGKRPDTGGDQRPLSRQALAVPRHSEHRGNRTGYFADHIRRTKIKRSGFEATSSIVPPPNRNVYVADERKHGVNLLTLAGKSGEVVRQAARDAVAKIAQGGKVPTNDREVEAEDIK